MPGRHSDSLSAFPYHLSNLLIDAGPQGFGLAEASFLTGQTSLVYRPARNRQAAPTMFPLALGEPVRFASHDKRREIYWLPSADAPAFMQIAWLVSELSDATTAFTAESIHLTALRHDGGPDTAVDLTFNDQTVTITIRVDGRTAPMEFPAVAIRDLLIERAAQPDGHAQKPFALNC